MLRTSIISAAVIGALTAGVNLGHGSTLVGKPLNTAAASCTLSVATQGAPLTLTGSGYTAGKSYAIAYRYPTGGTGGSAVWASSTGAISDFGYAYWLGTYTADVYSTQGKGALVASCSTTVS